MEKQENDSSFKLNIGGPSIILLLTVLGLSVFAILSIRAAYNGLKLSKTSENAVGVYYEAAGVSDSVEFEIREFIAEKKAAGITTDGLEAELESLDYVISAKNGVIVYEVPVNEGTRIRVELTGDGAYNELGVTEHRLYADTSDEYDSFGLEIDAFEIN